MPPLEAKTAGVLLAGPTRMQDTPRVPSPSRSQRWGRPRSPTSVIGVRGPLSQPMLALLGLVRDHHGHAEETCTRRRKRRKRKGNRTDLFPLQGQGKRREVKKRGKRRKKKQQNLGEKGPGPVPARPAGRRGAGRSAGTSFRPRFLMFSFLALTKSKSFPYSSLRDTDSPWETARREGPRRGRAGPAPTSRCC